MSLVPLSSIHLPAQKVGELVGAHLEAVVQNKRQPKRQLLPPERVAVRASTDLVAIEDPIIAKAVREMRNRAHERITIGDILARLPVSRRRFGERFQQVLGRSPKEELSRIRVGLARNRLLDSNDTIFQIALECGFPDTESMARQFKQWEGTTPHTFRKQNQS